MSKDKKELYFWKRYFNIHSIAAIPQEIDKYSGIDSDEDDQFFLYLTSRVPVIHSIDLRCTFITDEGVKYISNLKELKELSLRNHNNISKESLPFLNQLTDLVYLDISKTEITLDDLASLYNLQNLKELHISAEESKENILEKISILKKQLPNCLIHVNDELYS
jgi:Leucine-rich repeat (LRR) protein